MYRGGEKTRRDQTNMKHTITLHSCIFYFQLAKYRIVGMLDLRLVICPV